MTALEKADVQGARQRLSANPRAVKCAINWRLRISGLSNAGFLDIMVYADCRGDLFVRVVVPETAMADLSTHTPR